MLRGNFLKTSLALVIASLASLHVASANIPIEGFTSEAKGGTSWRYRTPFGSTEPENIQRIMRSTVRIGQCSGSIVSNEGHVLTALHCLNQGPEIVELAGLQTTVWGRATQLFPAIPALILRPSRMLAGMLATIQFQNGLDLNHLSASYQAEVVATGKGYAMNFPLQTGGTYDQTEEERALGQSMIHDFAIVKIPDLVKLRQAECVQINPEITVDNSYVSVGYPLHQGEQEDYDDTGLPVANPARIETASDPQSTFDQLLPAATYAAFQSRVRVGMSGGGVFNTQGKVVAVNAYQDRSVGETVDGFAPRLLAYRVDSVIKSLADSHDDASIHQIFDCRD